jgi:hypothetical protein
MGEDDLYNGLYLVGSASGNDAQASPRETMCGPSAEGCGEVFAKLQLYMRGLQTRCTCFKTRELPLADTSFQSVDGQTSAVTHQGTGTRRC